MAGGETQHMARILIVDDEAPIRKLLRQILEREGYEVIDAPDGMVATELYHEAPADLIIMDILMPEKDGLETMVELCNEYPSTKVIAISGGGVTGRLNLLPAAQHLGAIRTFKKPFDRRELLDAVTELLRETPHRTEPTGRHSAPPQT